MNELTPDEHKILVDAIQDSATVVHKGRKDMNERIKELAEQAGYTKDMFGIGHWDMPECQKFAELIVEECVGLCETAAYAPRPALNPTPVEQYAFIIGEGNMAVNLAKQIRKHFGVEE